MTKFVKFSSCMNMALDLAKKTNKATQKPIRLLQKYFNLGHTIDMEKGKAKVLDKHDKTE